MKQTYILKVWHGADTYIDAARKGINGDKTVDYDFYRFSCKKSDTVRKALIKYVEQAEYKGFEKLYPSFFSGTGMYSIVSTPDGYNEGETVETGYVKNLLNE